MADTTWLTPQAYAKLQEELSELQGSGRIHIRERIAEARSHGDIRENADYDAAKNEQGLMEARIRQIKHIIDHSEVREPSNNGVAEVGCVVTVVDSDGDEMEFFLAAKENKVPGFLLASPDGPLGNALMGAKPGDTVTYEAPAGTFSYEVKSVRPF